MLSILLVLVYIAVASSHRLVFQQGGEHPDLPGADVVHGAGFGEQRVDRVQLESGVLGQAGDEAFLQDQGPLIHQCYVGHA